VTQPDAPHSSPSSPGTADSKETSSSTSSPGGEVRLKLFARTDVGQIREHNEDNFLVADLSKRTRGLLEGNRAGPIGKHGSLFAVCDGMVVNVEIKNAPQDPGWDPGEAVAALTAAGIEEAGWTDRVIVSSFQVPTLLAVQAADPRLALGALWGFAVDPGRALAEAADAGFRAVHPFVSSVDAELVGRAHVAGLAVNVWTVNAPDDLRAMVERGVDAVITDRIDDALAIAGGKPT